MKWTNYRLGDLIEIKHGYAFSGTYITQEDNGIVLVTPGNFRIGGGFQEEKCKFFNGDVPEEYILRPGDLIVTMTDLSKNTDTLGYSALVPKSSRTYLHNQRIGLVKMKTDCVDYKFLYWLMRTHTYQRTIANSATGATVKHTSPTKIYEYQFNAPEKNVQKKIAGILSAYDDLIENNQKQIRLLEEAAMRLYKEWFVNLQFPGYENTKIVDGVPEGWEKLYIEDVCQTVGGGTPSTKVPSYYNNGTIPWVTPTDITRNDCLILLDTEKKITEEGLARSSAKMLPSETILMTSRASVGFFGISEQEVCTNQGFISCIPNNKNLMMFLLLNLMSRKDEIRQKAGGATYLEINKSTFRKLIVIKPDDTLLNEFQSITYTILKRISALKKQSDLLKQARDKLLPKLMNGEIEV